MKYIVYLTTNIKNNKIYIGVHKTDNPEIFDGYLGCGVNRYNRKSIYNPKTPFQFAIKKYGFDSFRRATIKIFDNEQDALMLEEELVNEDFIKRNDTYNIVIGGGMPPLLNKIIYQYDLQGNFIKQYNSIVEASKDLNTAETAIGRAVLNKRTSAGYLWSDIKVNKLNLEEYYIYTPKQTVHIYDSNGFYYKSFQSLQYCAKYLESSLSHIQRSIKLGTKTKNYYISNILMGMFEKPKVIRLDGMVHQYSLNGEYICSYNSLKELEQKFGESMQWLNNSIKLGQSYKNYLWFRGDKPDLVKPYKPKSMARKIGQYTMNDKLVKVFNTVREARKEFPNVSKVLNGNANHCHNYKFKYLE